MSFPGMPVRKTAEDCEEPVCESAVDFMKMSKKVSGLETKHRDNCPLNREELGKNTWSFLHTMAAYYPEKPTKSDTEDMTAFLKSFSRFYPCRTCARDLKEDLGYFPPEENVSTRIDLAKYFCMLHNRVNVKLGKEGGEFDCSIENLDKRWRKNKDDC